MSRCLPVQLPKEDWVAPVPLEEDGDLLPRNRESYDTIVLACQEAASTISLTWGPLYCAF